MKMKMSSRAFHLSLISIFLATTACSPTKLNNYENTPGAILWLSYHNNIPDKCIKYFLERYLGTTSRSEDNIKEATNFAIRKASTHYYYIKAANESIKSEEKVFRMIKEGVDRGFETPNARKEAYFLLGSGLIAKRAQ